MADDKEKLEIKLSDDNFEDEVIKSDIPVIVDFWAPWCGPCSMAAPVIQKIAEDYKGKVKVCKLNVDEGQNSAGKYGIMNIPTIGFFINGELKDKVIGVVPNFENIIKGKIDGFLKE